MINEHGFNYHASPSGLISILHFLLFFSIDHLRLDYVSRKKCLNFSLKPVYFIMVGESFQIYGVQIIGFKMLQNMIRIAGFGCAG